MFTGIVGERARVKRLSRGQEAWSLALEGAFVKRVRRGDSVCVQGACLTVTAKRGGAAYFDLSPGTRRRTTLGQLRPGQEVNIELSLRPADRLGGHIVLGHVDGVGRVKRVAGGKLLIEAPRPLAKYLIPRGSIAVDGVSLTITAVRGTTFSANLIPYTRRRTTLGQLKPGQRVNLEVDPLAKLAYHYLARLLPRLLRSSARARPRSRAASVAAASR